MSQGPGRYKGLLVKADLQLHGQVAAAVQDLAKPGAKVLDFGAGEGALSERLHDLGYDVLAVDMDQAAYRASPPFQRVDFNDRAQVERFLAAHAGRHDVVLGIEVIEHVENPWQYLRDLKGLARPGGAIVVSTPNVTSAFSRLWFLVRGRMAQFDEGDLAYGHINPLTEWELRTIAKGIGLEVERLEPAGRTGRWLPGLPPKVRVLNALAVLLSPLMRGITRGHCLLVVLRRPGR